MATIIEDRRIERGRLMMELQQARELARMKALAAREKRERRARLLRRKTYANRIARWQDRNLSRTGRNSTRRAS